MRHFRDARLPRGSCRQRRTDAEASAQRRWNRPRRIDERPAGMQLKPPRFFDMPGDSAQNGGQVFVADMNEPELVVAALKDFGVPVARKAPVADLEIAAQIKPEDDAVVTEIKVKVFARQRAGDHAICIFQYHTGGQFLEIISHDAPLRGITPDSYPNTPLGVQQVKTGSGSLKISRKKGYYFLL